MNGKVIAIMGGTFNPIHNGHINAALITKRELCPDRVLFIPSGMPPHKDVVENEKQRKHRFNMTKIAVEDLDEFDISDIEIIKDEKCYTIDTLRQLKKQYCPNKMILIVGTDMFLCFEKWKDYDKILEISELAVVARFFDDIDRLYDKKKTFSDKQQEKIKILEDKVIQISSTEIRDMIKSGKCADEFLPPKVAHYIKLNNLYE